VIVRKIIVILIVVSFVSATIYVWFPPTYRAEVGFGEIVEGLTEYGEPKRQPIYETRINIKNLLLNLLPWVVFFSYLIVLKKEGGIE